MCVAKLLLSLDEIIFTGMSEKTRSACAEQFTLPEYMYVVSIDIDGCVTAKIKSLTEAG